MVREAHAFAELAHGGQARVSGEPFIEHPVLTASILADIQVWDAPTLQAALLHDVVEDSNVPLAEIEARFGTEVAHLVDGVTKVTRLTDRPRGMEPEEGELRKAALARTQAENLRKMLVAMAQDVRVVFIKLADRLHNMRTLGALPAPRRRRVAQETRDIYAPLAHRLGIYQIEWELEDLAFRYLEPQHYREVARLVAARRAEREEDVERATTLLKAELDRAGLAPEVDGRPKGLYSVYQKMQRYETSGRQFGDIYDLLAVRVIVPTVQDCYAALGVVHALWRPLPGQFDDYIASPRE
ncbi:MAG: bifunctional (p)ppGpp synthetase/guanosine-3',5'-bis(diphosphate) 3'-pyrophosphohydrolase, partial [Chloroflexi bacterium]|nr:bifunctional (p)ppGpp synthetase/guanosine-3',5'-bis(diphosphate) 3'-pyrophosphohydrolase [Chloroflexota bacterium]